ncbi:MAG: peptide/nickel transport system permease protein [Acetobacteraceae bacterium]|jgi:peptide/nickel transport system permease protein|nr:binding--dependent transport system inner rane component family protein [Rhodopila sp.]MEA2767222.1 peptide/nickel transport system permease protein [Acetobacteraceae bacterium]
MHLYILRRLLYTIPIIIGVSLVCFSFIHLAPGDPINSVLPEQASAEVVAQIKAAYGFDKPLPIQYLKWFSNVLSGDFGLSIMTRRPVLSEVGPAVAHTALLAVSATLLSFLLGTSLGLVAGMTTRRVTDRSVTAFSVVGISLPHYWLGMVMVVIFAVKMRMLPATGMGPAGADLTQFGIEDIKHLLLPAVTLAMIPTGIIARSVRATVAEVRRQDFVQTLKGKGLRRPRMFLHVIKNAAPPAIAIMGLQFAQLLGGSILVETVFSWPGTGFLLNAAISTRDLPLLQGTVIVLATFFVLTNVLVDIVQTLIDPRVRRA